MLLSFLKFFNTRIPFIIRRSGFHYWFNKILTVAFLPTKAILDATSCPPGEPNGIFATGDCTRVYVQCWRGRPTRLECGGGRVFNDINKQCNMRQEVNTPETIYSKLFMPSRMSFLNQCTKTRFFAILNLR